VNGPPPLPGNRKPAAWVAFLWQTGKGCAAGPV
jgi:hypothetical protein